MFQMRRMEDQSEFGRISMTLRRAPRPKPGMKYEVLYKLNVSRLPRITLSGEFPRHDQVMHLPCQDFCKADQKLKSLMPFAMGNIIGCSAYEVCQRIRAARLARRPKVGS
jgi:hypothetical protein